MAQRPERFLLAQRSLAVARVPATGELSDTWKEWAERYNAILVVPEGQADTEATRQLEVLQAKLGVIRDLLADVGDGKDTPWNHHGLVQFAKIVRELVGE